MDVFDLYAKLGLDSSEYEKGLSNAEKKGSNFGKGLGKAAKAGVAAVAAVGTAAIGAGTALVSGASDVADYGDTIDKMSQKIGISAEAYQEWDAVLEHSGASISGLKAGFKTMNSGIMSALKATEQSQAEYERLSTALANGEISLEEFNEANEALTESTQKSLGAFGELGFTVEDLAKMAESPEDAFSQIITQLQGMDEGAERSALATKLLGRSAMELAPLLNTSAEETQAMKDKVHELGGVMSNDAVKASAKFQDTLQDLETGFDGLKRNMMSDFLPSITTVMEGMTSILSGDTDEGIEQISKGIEEVVNNISNLLPKIVEVAVPVLEAIGKALIDNLPVILPVLTTFVMDISDMIVQNLPLLIDTAMQMIVTISQGLVEALPELIPTIVDVILQIVDTLIDNIDLLIDASIEIMIALANGLVEALPRLVEKAPVIIQKLVDAIVRNTPKLLSAAFQVIISLVSGIISNLPQIVGSAYDIINALIDGIIGQFGNLLTVGEDLIDQVAQGIANAIVNAKEWGADLIDNFVSGITDGVGKVVDAVSGVAGAVADFIGFSEPKKGPLSKFHTFAPDMIDLFTEGIDDNINEIQKASEEMASAMVPDVPDYEGKVTVAEVSQATSTTQSPVVDTLVSEMKKMIDTMTSQQETVIPIYIGNKMIDELVLDANRRIKIKSGGFANV